jgi:hypothetical protein
MAAPPPQNDQETSAITFGIAAMDQHLDDADLDYPATPDDILRALGDRAIPFDPRGNRMSLQTALEMTDKQSFASRRELLNALHPVFEEKRKRGSFGGWLKSILPF